MKTTSKLAAGLAVAFALSASQASAVSLFSSGGGSLVQAGGPGYSKEFDISSYLQGGAYTAVNVRVTAGGSSDPAGVVLQPPGEFTLLAVTNVLTLSEPVCVFGACTRGEKTIWSTYREDRTVTTLDEIVDGLRLDVGEAVAVDYVDHFYSESPAVKESNYQRIRTGSDALYDYTYYDTITPYRTNITDVWAGSLSALAVLTANDLANLNSTGKLNVALDAPAGAYKLSGIRLDFDLVSAVPEPSTWAMMLVGFFGAGSALRARRRQGLTA